MMRRGQVALYLLFFIVAIALIAFMDVDIFMSVTAKNRAMNAADAAALAVARHQGNLLNLIGNDNLAHLDAAIDNKEEECHELVVAQMQNCFLGPLKAIGLSNEAAQENVKDLASNTRIEDIFKDHANVVLNDFVNNPELFMPPYDRITGKTTEGCDWVSYANELLAQLGGGLLAGPENAEFADELEIFPLMSKHFYEAAEGKVWCWFRTYGHEDLLDIPAREFPDPFLSHEGVIWNSEIYSLHLRFASWQERGIRFDAAWTNMIIKLTGRTAADIAESHVLTNANQVWAFYDGEWREWGEVSPTGNRYNRGYGFPVLGEIKPEYDVKGCLAQCRVKYRNVSYQPMAKCFGTVENLKDEIEAVTCADYRKLVLPSFTDVRLVPVAPTGWITHDTSDADWREHVQHLKEKRRELSCNYCRILDKWDDETYRAEGKAWLELHACEVSSPDGDMWGGAPYAY